MGIFDKVGNFISGDTFRDGVREMMVSRPSENTDLIWHYPHSSIPLFAQCAIRGDEWAVFTMERRAVGTLETGRATLSSENIPFLAKLVDHYRDGKFFMTDLFFVARTPYLVPIAGEMGAMVDPLTRVTLHPKCVGDVFVQVVNPEQLLAHCVTMQWPLEQASLLGHVAEMLPSVIRNAALRLAAEQHRSVLSVLSEDAELSEAASQPCDDLAQMGLQVARIRKFDFDLPPHEFESFPLAMTKTAGAASSGSQRTSETGVPPIVQQIFERGLREGELSARRNVLLRLLVRAGISLNEEQLARVTTCSEVATLDRWIDSVGVVRAVSSFPW